MSPPSPFAKGGRVGFIGLGVMGAGMAHGLLRKGYPLHVYARRAEAAASHVAEGAELEFSPAAVARKCGLVFLCLSDTAAVEQVLFGPAGLAEGLAPGSCVVDTSTISASAAREFGRRLAEQGVWLLDAPVSGGQQGAEQGTLACMVGGDAEALAACRDALAAFCKTITHVGGVGAGQAVKACNQVAVAGAMLGVADAIALARSQGVAPRVMREVLLGGSARSFALEKHGARIIDGDFQPGFRARLMRKDLGLALEAARASGAVLPTTEHAERMLAELCETGRAEQDWNSIGLLVQEKSGLAPD